MKILGIDPGSRITGYGVVDADGPRLTWVDAGTLNAAAGNDHGRRLKIIYDGVEALIKRHQPDVFAIERVFVSRNPASALILGQARGSAMVAGVNHDLDVFEYSAKEIKLAVVGKGAADKQQVQHMVRVLLGLTARPPQDAADALACAICHAHTARFNDKLKSNVSLRDMKYEINPEFKA